MGPEIEISPRKDEIDLTEKLNEVSTQPIFDPVSISVAKSKFQCGRLLRKDFIYTLVRGTVALDHYSRDLGEENTNATMYVVRLRIAIVCMHHESNGCVAIGEEMIRERQTLPVNGCIQ